MFFSKSYKYFKSYEIPDLSTMEIQTESPIEQLSDDILLEILSMLDGKSIMNAALVCNK